MEKYLELINKLIPLVGAATSLQDTKTWLEAKENWQKLRDEGHETDAKTADDE